MTSEVNIHPASSTVEQSCAGGAKSWIDLSTFENAEFNPGRSALVRTLWYFCSVLLFEGGWFPIGFAKIRILRAFGAKIGSSVVIKPNVRIKFPWRLRVGDHAWIGQGVWIDNLAEVTVGNDVCISQFCYLCTGSHDHRRSGFDLLTKSISIDDGAWVGARSTIFQGVVVGANSLVAGGSVVVKNVESAAIVAGNPAVQIGQRECPPA